MKAILTISSSDGEIQTFIIEPDKPLAPKPDVVITKIELVEVKE